MFFLAQVGKGYGEAFKGIIFDTEYKSLEDIKAQAKKFFLPLGGCVFKDAFANYYFEWTTGERLYLRAAVKIEDARKYLGHEYSYILFNELSKWQNSELYDFMLSTMRIGSKIDLPTRVFSTTNPYGPGAPWVKKRFVEGTPSGVVKKEDFEVWLGGEKYQTVTKTKVLISGNYTQNPYYRAEDIANLMESVEHNPELKAAWMYCDWNASYVDGAFGDIWHRDTHIVPDFQIPANWRVDRSFDWGSSTPFAVCWFAESPGEEIVHEGKRLFFPRGTIVLINEWYGSRDGQVGRNRGSRLTPTEVADGIKLREGQMRNSGMFQNRDHYIYGGPADNQIANVNQSDYDTIKVQMESCDISWDESDKSQGSRNQGFNITRQRLKNSIKNEEPGFFVQQKCKNTIESIPSLQKDQDGYEDIEKGQEDHLYDAIRYRLLASDTGVLDVVFSLR